MDTMGPADRKPKDVVVTTRRESRALDNASKLVVSDARLSLLLVGVESSNFWSLDDDVVEKK